MARRRRSTRVKLNTKLMIDIINAGLIVRNLPKIINMVIPLDPMISTVAAVGGGYVAGVFFKRPDLANASIAVGIAQFVDPFIDDLIGGIGGGIPLSPVTTSGMLGPPVKEPASAVAIGDYLNLNDYINDPSGSMPATAYGSAY